MTPLGLLGPLAPEWFKDNKVLGCPHPHIPSGKKYLIKRFIPILYSLFSGKLNIVLLICFFFQTIFHY